MLVSIVIPNPTNLHGLCVELYLPYPEGYNRQQHPCLTNLHGLCVELYLPYPEGDNRQQHPCPTNQVDTALHINHED
jgi:hypothetical protein